MWLHLLTVWPVCPAWWRIGVDCLTWMCLDFPFHVWTLNSRKCWVGSFFCVVSPHFLSFFFFFCKANLILPLRLLKSSPTPLSLTQSYILKCLYSLTNYIHYSLTKNWKCINCQKKDPSVIPVISSILWKEIRSCLKCYYCPTLMSI